MLVIVACLFFVLALSLYLFGACVCLPPIARNSIRFILLLYTFYTHLNFAIVSLLQTSENFCSNA